MSTIYEDQHPCPVCGKPVDNFAYNKPQKYCSKPCQYQGAAIDAERRRRVVNLETCNFCACEFLPSAELEPGYCSLRCAHGRKRRVA